MKKWTKLFSLAIGALMAIGAAVGVKQTAERVNAEDNVVTLSAVNFIITPDTGFDDASVSCTNNQFASISGNNLVIHRTGYYEPEKVVEGIRLKK